MKVKQLLEQTLITDPTEIVKWILNHGNMTKDEIFNGNGSLTDNDEFSIDEQTGHVNFWADLEISNKQLKNIPIKIESVASHFDCSHNQLSSFNDLPKKINPHNTNSGVFRLNNNAFETYHHAYKYFDTVNAVVFIDVLPCVVSWLNVKGVKKIVTINDGNSVGKILTKHLNPRNLVEAITELEALISSSSSFNYTEDILDL